MKIIPIITKNLRMLILYYLNKKKVNKRGQAPIYCRITIHGRRAEVSTGIFITPNDWNPGTHTVKDSAPNYEVHNLLLQDFSGELVMAKRELIRQGNNPTGAMVFDFIRKRNEPEKPPTMLVEVLSEFMQEKAKAHNFQSIRHYAERLRKVNEFLKERKTPLLPAESVDMDFGLQYISYLQSENYHPNTIYKHVQVLSQAMKFGVIKKMCSTNEIAYIKMQYKIPDKIETITENMRKQLESYTFGSPQLNHAKDLFLLQCWTGVEYADLVKLNDSATLYRHTTSTIIDYCRHKSKVRAILPLFNKAEEILHKHTGTIRVYSNPVYNRLLKEIASILNWTINLKSNTGRKSFGQHRLNEGYSMESVARMMGHTNIKTTQSYYARIGAERLIYEREKLSGTYN